MQLPLFPKFTEQTFVLLQTKWTALLNPLLGLPILNGVMLKNMQLTAGENIINHKLGRTQQGWILTDFNAAVGFNRSQPFNDKTLALTVTGAVTVSIWCF